MVRRRDRSILPAAEQRRRQRSPARRVSRCRFSSFKRRRRQALSGGTGGTPPLAHRKHSSFQRGHIELGIILACHAACIAKQNRLQTPNRTDRPVTRPTALRPTLAEPTARIAVGALCAIAASAAVFLLLDLYAVVAMRSRLESAISAYGVGSGRWIFTLAILFLAAGSAALLVAVVDQQLTRWRSGATVALTLWVLGLLAIAIFPKQDWSQPPSISGSIHLTASGIAFVSLPIAAVLLAKPWLRHRTHGVHARRTRLFAWLAIASFSPLLYAFVVAAVTGVAWWEVVTFGHSERLLAVSEVATLAVIGTWVLTRK